MANREALRELQARLADRLAQVRTEVRAVSWLAVECGDQGLLFPLAGAGEIFSVEMLMPVPHTQAWFAGVANLRGGLHGVIDIAVFLGMESQTRRRDHHLLVSLNASLGIHSALLVDKLAGLRSAEQLLAEPVEQGPLPEFAGKRWKDSQGRQWQEIDLAALSRHEQFLAIAQ